MERFYLKVLGNYVSVYHRPTHRLIEFLPDNEKDAKARVLELIKMSTEDFYTLMFSKEITPQDKFYEDVTKEQEDWYKGAWKFHTDRYIVDNNIKVKIPDEEMPFEFIAKLVKASRKDTEGWSTKKNDVPISPKETIEEPKKEVRKLLTKKPKLSPLEELEKTFKSGNMSLREYIKTKKEIISKQ